MTETIHVSAVINAILSLIAGILALFLQTIAFAKDFRYPDKRLVINDVLRRESPIPPELAGLTHKESVEFYFKDHYWNMWDEPMAIIFSLAASIISYRHLSIYSESSVVAKSIFLFGVTNITKMIILAIAVYLTMKSYLSIDSGYMNSFMKASKLGWIDLYEDGYMRLVCYDGYFTYDVDHDEFMEHFDEGIFAEMAIKTQKFRVKEHICQSSKIKIWSVALMLASLMFAALGITFSVCCDTSVQNVLIFNKVSPQSTEMSKNKYEAGFKDIYHSTIQIAPIKSPKKESSESDFQPYSNPWSDKSLNVTVSNVMPNNTKKDQHNKRKNILHDEGKSLPYTPSFPYFANH